jgi:imidazoleglycerol phosphate dehydratase HisB
VIRTADVTRNTKETQIRVQLNLDGTGASKLATGIGFFDHMLDQVARHGLFDLEIEARGDLHIDGHHTVEDVGITLGQAVAQAALRPATSFARSSRAALSAGSSVRLTVRKEGQVNQKAATARGIGIWLIDSTVLGLLCQAV